MRGLPSGWLAPMLVAAALVAWPSTRASGEERPETAALRPELVVQLGHRYSVSSVAFSADGRFVATGGRDDTVRLWELDTGREVRRFTPSDNLGDDVLSVAISPDGGSVLAGTQGGRVFHWDLVSGRLIRLFDLHAGFVQAVAFTPDGRPALSGDSHGEVVVVGSATGRVLHRLKSPGEQVMALAASPDGRSCLVGIEKGPTTLWDLESARGRGAPLVYVDARELPEAYRLVGRYLRENGTIRVSLRLVRGRERVARFEVEGVVDDLESVVERILREARKHAE